MHTVRYGLTALALLATVAACAPMTEAQGNAPDPELVAGIKPGQHNRAQVARMVGSPSSTATFDANTWYYISKRTEQFAFFEPKIVEQKVIVVRFDDDGVVSGVEKLNGEHARDVDLVARTTPTRGRELSVMGQLYKTLLRGTGSALGDPSTENEGFTRY